MDDRRLAIAVGLDSFAVVAFVAIGLRNHDQDSALGYVLTTAAPFLIGLGIGWMVARAWRRPTRVLTGLIVWPVTVLAGMVLRNLVFDRGTATSFVVVATLFLGACLVGWRLVARALARRGRPSMAQSRLSRT